MISVNYLQVGNNDIGCPSRFVMNIIDFYHLLKCHAKGYFVEQVKMRDIIREYRNNRGRDNYCTTVMEKEKLIKSYLDSLS
jgi:hypothetical protein